MSNLLHRIAEYFKEWDGQEPAPTMQVNIDDLRYIASMNTENCSLRERLQREKHNDGWIPVSEQPPKEPCVYTVEDYSPYTVAKYGEPQRKFLKTLPLGSEMYERIVAWKPVEPQPYKESEEE